MNITYGSVIINNNGILVKEISKDSIGMYIHHGIPLEKDEEVYENIEINFNSPDQGIHTIKNKNSNSVLNALTSNLSVKLK